MADTLQPLAMIPAKTKIGKLAHPLILATLPLSFLMGRSDAEGLALPLCAAFLSGLGLIPVNRLLLFFTMGFGMLTAGEAKSLLPLAGVFLGFTAYQRLFPSREHNLVHPLAAAAGVLVVEILGTLIRGGYTYDYLSALLHAFMALAMSYAFKGAFLALSALGSGEGRLRQMSQDQAVSFSFLLFFALSGLSGVVFSGIPAGTILTVFFILLFAYRYGPGVGSSSGVTAGIVMIMTTTAHPVISALYAFCGLLCGIFRKMGRPGAILGFLLGNAVITFYLNTSAVSIHYFRDIASAALLFILVPRRILESLPGYLSREREEAENNDPASRLFQQRIAGRMRDFSQVFRQLAGVFKTMEGDMAEVNLREETARLIDLTVARVCRDCSLKAHCWERNFFQTYQEVMSLLGRIDHQGRVSPDDYPVDLGKRCGYLSRIVEELFRSMEMHRLERAWEERLRHCRKNAAHQMDGIAEALSVFSGELGQNAGTWARNETGEEIRTVLESKGMSVSDVVLWYNITGRREVIITHSGCGGRRQCIRIAEKTVSALLGCAVAKADEGCRCDPKSGSCALHLVQKLPFKVLTGVAQRTKTGGTVCGDSCIFMTGDDGVYTAAVSDGMGSGGKAAILSNTAVNLLEGYLSSGFDREQAIRLINSTLSSCADHESFATLDVVSIDTQNGRARFAKAGAAPGFIKRRDGVECIRSFQLPAGILEDVDLEIMERQLQDGEIVLLMTDGVYEAFKGDAGDIAALLEALPLSNPQELADMLVSRASLTSPDGAVPDDMLVLAAKMWKQA